MWAAIARKIAEIASEPSKYGALDLARKLPGPRKRRIPIVTHELLFRVPVSTLDHGFSVVKQCILRGACRRSHEEKNRDQDEESGQNQLAP
jgi:hypothetical protein